MTLQWPGRYAVPEGSAIEGKLVCAGILTGDAGIGSGPMGSWSVNVFGCAAQKPTPRMGKALCLPSRH